MDNDRVLIRTGQLLDVVAGTLLQGADILVHDGRVEAILGPGAARPEPGSVRAVDLTACTVLPGLIDAHAHLIGDPAHAGAPAGDATAASELAVGERNALAILGAGVTTVRDLGTYHGLLDLALRTRIDAGRAPGPRMQCSGAMITRPYGGGELTGDRSVPIPPVYRMGVVRSPIEVRRSVDRLINAGADVIKLIVTGAVLTLGTNVDDVELDEEMIRVAVETAGRRGVFVAAHAHGATGIRIASDAGVRSIEHGSLLDRAGIEALLRNDTWLVADVYNGDWIDEVGRRDGWPAETLAKNAATTDTQRAGFTAAIAAGVRVAFGTDSGVFPHELLARQFPIMVRLGMSPLEAIRAATIGAAELMGWSDRVGSLAQGRFADLIAVEGDPTLDIGCLARPVVVAKGGVLVRDDRPTYPGV